MLYYPLAIREKTSLSLQYAEAQRNISKTSICSPGIEVVMG